MLPKPSELLFALFLFFLVRCFVTVSQTIDIVSLWEKPMEPVGISPIREEEMHLCTPCDHGKCGTQLVIKLICVYIIVTWWSQVHMSLPTKTPFSD